jgi:Chaperone of endosialidase
MLYDPNTRRIAISKTTKYSGTGTFVVADDIPYSKIINSLCEPQTYTPVWFGDADYTTANLSSIVLGDRAGGLVTTSLNSISINPSAGSINQGAFSVAIGNLAGVNQSYQSVAIGLGAGQINQLDNSIAIGTNAGRYSQGAYSIAIGYHAGSDMQPANSICIAANLGTTLPAPYSCCIRPIRNINGTVNNRLYYDATTGELIWGTDPSSLRYKQDIVSVPTKYIDAIYKLKPVEFAFKSSPTNRTIGLIAEDVLGQIPEIVTYNALDDTVIEGLDINRLIAPLVAIVQEHKRQLYEYKCQFQDVNEKYEKLLEKVNEMMRHMSSQ